MWRPTAKALTQLTNFARKTIGLQEIGLGTVENPEEYLRWASTRTGPGVVDDIYLSLKGAAGALTVRMDHDEYHIVLGGAYRNDEEVEAALAHELAHIKQHTEDLFPHGLKYPAGATRAVLLPLEIGAEELVLHELPEVALTRARIASREAKRWKKTGNPAIDLDNSLVSVPITLAFERLGLEAKIPQPKVDEPYATARRTLIQTARRTDPWDKEEIETYCRKAAALVTELLTHHPRTSHWTPHHPPR